MELYTYIRIPKVNIYNLKMQPVGCKKLANMYSFLYLIQKTNAQFPFRAEFNALDFCMCLDDLVLERF